MFTDISGSTRMYEVMGSRDAHGLVTGAVALLSGIMARHGGTVVETVGDEVMCSFARAGDALAAAFEMQRSFRDMPFPLPGNMERPGVRVGLHAGRVAVHGHSLFGDAVNMAARMVSLAGPGQTIATDTVMGALKDEPGMVFMCLERTVIRDRKEEVRVYEVVPAGTAAGAGASTRGDCARPGTVGAADGDARGGAVHERKEER